MTGNRSATTFAVDTGGTFTDLIIESDGELRMFKSPTTPDDPVEGVLNVLGLAADRLNLSLDGLLSPGDLFIHGTTRAINALVTDTAARTAFLTTQGHPDILLFREGGRAEPFNFAVPYPEPLVPRALTYEVPERIAADGSVLSPLDEAAVIELIGRLARADVEAVGVSLLWSIVNPDHEIRVGELLDRHLPGVPYTLSHRLNPTLREYRRASSTCIDASLKPLMSRYLASLQDRLADAGFPGRLLIVTSQGGMLDASDVAAAPIHSINSGPAMAPVAGRFYAERESGHQTAIIADTGGTTFDVSLVRAGHLPRTRETWIGEQYRGHITGFPSVDVTSIGAGGGSIAWIDDGGLLRVGPQSAGSTPGPACYGQGGTHATVTDACLVLGHLDPGFFLGGALPLDVQAAEQALARAVGDPLNLSPEQAAAAVVRVATENMVHAIEEITVSQGIDPRRAILVGGGGAAGLNLVAIAARLGCRQVLIPETGAALSAAGALLSDLTADSAATLVTSTEDFDEGGVNEVLSKLRRDCESFARGAAPEAVSRIDYSVEARYPRQNWEIEVPVAAGRFEGPGDVTALADAFHREHSQLFAISDPDSHVDVFSWRARVSVAMNGGGERRLTRTIEARPARRARRVHFQREGWTEARILDFEDLPPGGSLTGPAVIESSFTTVVVDPGVKALRSEPGNLILTLEPAP